MSKRKLNKQKYSYYVSQKYGIIKNLKKGKNFNYKITKVYK